MTAINLIHIIIIESLEEELYFMVFKLITAVKIYNYTRLV
jgi:hypothetical protein